MKTRCDVSRPFDPPGMVPDILSGIRASERAPSVEHLEIPKFVQAASRYRFLVLTLSLSVLSPSGVCLCWCLCTRSVTLAVSPTLAALSVASPLYRLAKGEQAAGEPGVGAPRSAPLIGMEML